MAIITTKCEADRAFALTPSLCTACPQDQESEIAPGTASRDQWRPIDTGEARRGPFPLTSWANAPSVISQVHRPRTRLSRQHTRAIGRADVLSADVCDLLKYLLGTNAAKFTHTCRSTLFEPDGGIHGKIPINQRCRSVLRCAGRTCNGPAGHLRPKPPGSEPVLCHPRSWKSPQQILRLPGLEQMATARRLGQYSG